jgi:Ala-tRNA(Pro) deacylase
MAAYQRMARDMTIATTVGDALEFEGVDFRVLRRPDSDARDNAPGAYGVEPEARAKALLLKDAQGFVLTVVSAARVLDMDLLCRELHRELVPAGDEDLDDLFCDCELGSVPPIGPWYRVPTIVDASLRDRTSVFFDGGEPRSLVRVTGQGFAKLLRDAEYLEISNAVES